MLARPDRDLVKRVRSDLDVQDLSGLLFDNRDLRAVSFRNSDLSNVRFQSCDLRGARFEGAFLKRTRFDGSNLEGAHFGDLGRAESVLVDRQPLEEPDQIRAWVEKMTGQARP